MIHVGDTMSTMGGVQYRGGAQITKDYSPTVLNTPHGTHDTPKCIMIFPHRTEHPPRY